MMATNTKLKLSTFLHHLLHSNTAFKHSYTFRYHRHDVVLLPAALVEKNAGTKTYYRYSSSNALNAATNTNNTTTNLIRLSKRMSELNLCSRREADKLISNSRVLVNGINVGNQLGIKVSSTETNIEICMPHNKNNNDIHCNSTPSNNETQDHNQPNSNNSNWITRKNNTLLHWDNIRGDTIVLHKPKDYVSGQPDPKHGHIPAVRLLTRNNIFFPSTDDGNDDDYKELKYTLSCGRYLHFAKKHKIQRGKSRPSKNHNEYENIHKRKVDSDHDNKKNSNNNGIEGDNNTTSNPSTLINYAPAGRLDLDSTGVLIFTRNGVIAKKILSSSIEKEYIVDVEPVMNLTRQERNMGITSLPYPPKWDLSDLTRGGKRLWNDRVPLKPLIEAEWIVEDSAGRSSNSGGGQWNGTGTLRLVLQEGKKRQIRRMCRELLGLNVKELKRVRVGSIKLGTLPEGRWRTLTEREINEILQ